MYPTGHFGIALLFSASVVAFLHPRTQTGFTLFTLFAAGAPDVAKHVSWLVPHGRTNTVAFALVVGAVGGALAGASVVAGRRTSAGGPFDQFDPIRVFSFVGAALFLGTLSHVVGDMLVLLPGTQPVSPFWPVSDWTAQFEVLDLGQPLRNAVFLLVGLLVHTVISLRTPSNEE